MKKRTVKDFVALYAPEDEEKLVLIQDGYQRGQNLSGYLLDQPHTPCSCHGGCPDRAGDLWPLLPEAGRLRIMNEKTETIPSCFPKGQIYRIKARAWEKATPSVNPSGMSRKCWRKVCPVRSWRRSGAEYTKPILLKDEVLGTLTLDREMSTFDGDL